jgi:hypothetical protein
MTLTEEGEEIETFIKAKAGMTQGWTGSFDKLEEYLLLATVGSSVMVGSTMIVDKIKKHKT